MQEKELQIISQLRKDAKSSLSLISKIVEMPSSTIFDKINKFHNLGIIKKNVALLDYKKLGYSHHNKILLKISHGHQKDLVSFLQSEKCVNSVFEVIGEYNFLIETLHKDAKEQNNFVNLLKESFNIEIEELQVMEEVKKEEFIC